MKQTINFLLIIEYCIIGVFGFIIFYMTEITVLIPYSILFIVSLYFILKKAKKKNKISYEVMEAIKSKNRKGSIKVKKYQFDTKKEALKFAQASDYRTQVYKKEEIYFNS